jgi:hypothetical protein
VAEGTPDIPAASFRRGPPDATSIFFLFLNCFAGIGSVNSGCDEYPKWKRIDAGNDDVFSLKA